MIAFILRRLLQSIAVLLAVGLVAFSLFRYVGDPINAMVGQDTSMEDGALLREKLGLKDLPTRAVPALRLNAARGNFGLSYRTSEPVGRMIFERMPANLELTFCAASSVLAACRWGSNRPLSDWSSHLLQTVSLLGVSLPPFLLGILLILVFAVVGWLPSFGRGQTLQMGWWTRTSSPSPASRRDLAFDHVRPLPAHADHAPGALGDAGGMRTDYIEFGRARGLTNRAINFGHALKNTLVPVITVMGMQLATSSPSPSSPRGALGQASASSSCNRCSSPTSR